MRTHHWFEARIAGAIYSCIDLLSLFTLAEASITTQSEKRTKSDRFIDRVYIFGSTTFHRN